MRLQDYDISKENVNIQDTIEDVRNILNRGNYEIKYTTQSSPNWTESVNGILVLSVFGASARLYVSNNSAANGWSYAALTDL